MVRLSVNTRMNNEEELVSIAQLFEEELEAVIDMAVELKHLRSELDPFSEDYYAITAELVKLEQTGLYLQDRLNDKVPCKWLK